MLESFTVDTFSGRLGDTFRITTGTGQVDTTLVEAEPRPHSSTRYRAPFALLFRGPTVAPIRQGMYRVDHAALGSFDLFIVPVGPDDEGLCYEAVFA